MNVDGSMFFLAMGCCVVTPDSDCQLLLLQEQRSRCLIRPPIMKEGGLLLLSSMVRLWILLI